MATANPYRPPKADVSDHDGEEFQPVRVFSAAGRIGRLRYIGYSIGITMLIGIIAGVITGAVGKSAAAGIVMMAAWLVIFIVQFLLTIQRSHDFNMSGWLSLLMFVPLVNLLFWFVPGTDGSNRFGAPPPPNNKGLVVVVVLLPIVFVGILAAIAVPAYQQYVERARAAGQNR
jgi:uncharacterized membrane protein YhaH (DUF805 family)